MGRIGFLADDLTGAADVLAQAHARGLDAALSLDPSRPLPRAADVVGIAGPTRSLSGEALERAIHDGLRPFRREPIDVLIYKVCSTFDSSPEVGSIGRALEILHELWPEHGPIPVAPAQPEFGRYTAFSQHFGRYGGDIHRLDRHPVMRSHPSTPMHEADLREVLRAQSLSLVEFGALHLPDMLEERFGARWQELRTAGHDFVVDAVEPEHLDRVASALLAERGTAIVVGSGGIMAALARVQETSVEAQPAETRASGPVLAVSASASSTTARQIDDAIAHGWVEIAVPTAALRSGDASGDWVDAITRALSAGRHVVAHTLRGGEDPRLSASPLRSEDVGGTIGRAARRMVERGLTRDVAVFGGDSSSHALLALGVGELRVAEQFVTAGPICRADAASPVAECRLLLKGGQVGPDDILRRFAGDDHRERSTS